MIITTVIDVKITKRNIIHFRNLGYVCKLKDTITITPDHLTKGSHQKIKVQCTNCGTQREHTYKIYLQCLKSNNIYVCKKCSAIKNEMTCITRYGVLNNSMLPEWKESVQNTWKNKTTKELKEIDIKHKQYYQEKFGVDYYTQTDEYKEKSKNTWLEKYNVSNPSYIDIVKTKRVTTKLKNFGFINNSQTKEWKDDIQKNYKIYNEKRKQTCLNKYGTEYVSQVPCIFKKQQQNSFKIKKYLDTDLYYQASYELDFLEKFYNKIEIYNGPSITYIFENTTHVYHTDFYIPKFNLIVEIKSTYTFEKDLKKNLRKHKYCLKQVYNFIFIIDKNYDQLNALLFNI